MSEIKALDTLREELKVCGCNPDKCISCSVPSKVRDGFDEVECEIAERYMLAPVDADGVPIHVGDVVEFGENRNQGIVKALNEHMVIAMHVDDGYTNYAKYGLLWNADACHHVEPRTLEDVLEEFADAAADVDERDREEWVPLLAKYADEIREIMGEGC